VLLVIVVALVAVGVVLRVRAARARERRRGFDVIRRRLRDGEGPMVTTESSDT
jgi:hypothetical protein